MLDRACEQLQVEVVAGGRGQVGQAHVAVWPFLQDTEIELLGVPGHSGVVVRDADADVVPGEGGERAGRVLRRICGHWHALQSSESGGPGIWPGWFGWGHSDC
jgi:hypothetical protein